MTQNIQVLIVEDDAIGRKNLVRIMRKEGYSVQSASQYGSAEALLSREVFDLVISDLMLEGDGNGIDVLEAAKRANADTEVIIITGHASVDSAIKAMQNGAFHYVQKPFRVDEVRLLAQRALEKRRLSNHVKQLEDEMRNAENRPVIVGKSEKIQSILRLIEQVGPTDANVMITGESGTGKELVASSLHRQSPRCDKNFLAINCASFTDELLANELFGHEKDAYTGATSARAGLLESAHGGTVFFDEVADMPLPMQAKLLRVIQERELIRVGGTKPIPIDVRMIAATNRDLKKAIFEGSFREDLFYRLNVIPIHIPCLSERREDIPLLASHLLNRILRQMDKTIVGFTEDAMKMLVGYEYPGNVRELENILERAAALCTGDVIGLRDLPSDLKHSAEFQFQAQAGNIKSMEEIEKEYIKWVLEQVGHNKTQAASVLGIDRVSLYRKLKKYESDKA